MRATLPPKRGSRVAVRQDSRLNDVEIIFRSLHSRCIRTRVRKCGDLVIQWRAQVAIVIGFQPKIFSICINQVDHQLWEWQVLRICIIGLRS